MAIEKLILLSVFYLGTLGNPKICAQNTTSSGTKIHSERSLFSSLHTLSIHIKDPAIHDSVFHFLKDKLQLPVYYNPLSFGDRSYAGIFAGNLVLEPCGPYSNFTYVSNDFKAIFFGLTFEPAYDISYTAKALQDKKIQHEVASDEYIYLKDPGFWGENIAISIMDKHERTKDHAKLDSLHKVMIPGSNSSLGIEYVKEIQLGIPNASHLERWKELIFPSELYPTGLWEAGNGLKIRFIQSSNKEVKGIVFKVQSLEKAGHYLTDNQLPFRKINQQLALDPHYAFGLVIFFTE